jgi:plastocyanin
MKKLIPPFFLASLILSFLIIASCMMHKKTANTQSHGAGNVWMKKDAFSPGVITVALNTTVTWTNKDLWAHTVTSDAGVFDSGKLKSGGTFAYTFSKPGTYTYHCDIHKMMTGKVIVTFNPKP